MINDIEYQNEGSEFFPLLQIPLLQDKQKGKRRSCFWPFYSIYAIEIKQPFSKEGGSDGEKDKSNGRE